MKNKHIKTIFRMTFKNLKYSPAELIVYGIRNRKKYATYEVRLIISNHNLVGKMIGLVCML
jgi:hypothetical protein